MKKSKHDDRAAAQTREPPARALRAPVTDRVNADPPIFHGMTAAEGFKIAVSCLIFYGVISALLAMLTGWLPIIPIVSLAGTGATLWYGSLWLAKIKRGRPEHYYNQAVSIWLAEHGISRKVFLLYTRFWSVGRDMPFGGFVSPLVVRERPGSGPAANPTRRKKKS